MTNFSYTKQPITKKELRAKSILDNKTGCWIWSGCRDKDGYGIIRRHKKDWKAHRVSMFIFNDILLSEFTDGVNNLVCHTCDNPSCLNPDHLFLGTPKANKSDSVYKGRHAHGISQWQSVLNEEQVKSIRDAREYGDTYKDIAERFGVGKSTVFSVCARQTWKHVR